MGGAVGFYLDGSQFLNARCKAVDTAVKSVDEITRSKTQNMDGRKSFKKDGEKLLEQNLRIKVESRAIQHRFEYQHPM